jgi:hypothetical protein
MRVSFADFAVGAPYDGPLEHGAVYIYHGSAEGVREKHSQVCFTFFNYVACRFSVYVVPSGLLLFLLLG